MSVHGIIEALVEIVADSFSILGPAPDGTAESHKARNDLLLAGLFMVAVSAAITAAFLYL